MDNCIDMENIGFLAVFPLAFSPIPPLGNWGKLLRPAKAVYHKDRKNYQP
ncbi:MAG: hypothetical protein RR848_04895 [Oscillospiraceae bacterium]